MLGKTRTACINGRQYELRTDGRIVFVDDDGTETTHQPYVTVQRYRTTGDQHAVSIHEPWYVAAAVDTAKPFDPYEPRTTSLSLVRFGVQALSADDTRRRVDIVRLQPQSSTPSEQLLMINAYLETDGCTLLVDPHTMNRVLVAADIQSRYPAAFIDAAIFPGVDMQRLLNAASQDLASTMPTPREVIRVASVATRALRTLHAWNRLDGLITRTHGSDGDTNTSR